MSCESTKPPIKSSIEWLKRILGNWKQICHVHFFFFFFFSSQHLREIVRGWRLLNVLAQIICYIHWKERVCMLINGDYWMKNHAERKLKKEEYCRALARA